MSISFHIARPLPFLRPARPAPRVVFVPLLDDGLFLNPADRRRIQIPAEMARRQGFETRIASLRQALEMQSDILYVQSRDFDLIAENIGKLKRDGRRVIFSFSDAIFFADSSRCHYEPRFIDRAVHVSQITPSIRAAFSAFDRVVAGSAVQMRQICALGLAVPEKCVCLLDPVDRATYRYRRGRRRRIAQDGLRIVWEGFKDNVPSLSVIGAALANVARDVPLELCVLTSARRRNRFMGTDDNASLARALLPGVPIRFVEWTAAAVSHEMSRAHIGLNPVLDDPFNWAKPANKSVILNGFGLPVIASANESNLAWIEEGRNGFTADTPEAWEQAFRSISDRSLGRMQRASLRKARRFQRVYPAMFSDILDRRD